MLDGVGQVLCSGGFTAFSLLGSPDCCKRAPLVTSIPIGCNPRDAGTFAASGKSKTSEVSRRCSLLRCRESLHKPTGTKLKSPGQLSESNHVQCSPRKLRWAGLVPGFRNADIGGVHHCRQVQPRMRLPKQREDQLSLLNGIGIQSGHCYPIFGWSYETHL